MLLYTAGLTEARRPSGDLFTVGRLVEFIEREVASGVVEPDQVLTNRGSMVSAIEAYERFDAREFGRTKVELILTR